jgi:hypothetical protein
MEELLEIKDLIKSGKYDDALLLLDFLEELGTKGVEISIHNYAKILLLHLIKHSIEQRTTKSWDVAIRIAVREIKYLNQRPEGKGIYLNLVELEEAIASAMDVAIDLASLEVHEGIYDYLQIEQTIDRKELVEIAMTLFF